MTLPLVVWAPTSQESTLLGLALPSQESLLAARRPRALSLTAVGTSSPALSAESALPLLRSNLSVSESFASDFKYPASL